uniref:Uncharacterized protein n=1 Tax=Anguilla anguilla TaxID=7936 RepID=A0A0E9R326_ANGAN
MKTEPHISHYTNQAQERICHCLSQDKQSH